MSTELKVDLVRSGVKQRDLAKWLGVSAAAVNRWANGSRRPTPEIMEQIQFFVGLASKGRRLDGSQVADNQRGV